MLACLNKKRLYLVVLLCCVFNIRCVETESRNQPDLKSSIIQTVDFIEVTGLGAAAAGKGVTEAQAKRDAAEIARIQAYELLVEALQGIGVSGDIGLKDMNIGEGKLIQLIQAYLVGVTQVGAIEYSLQEDGSWLAACTIQYPKNNAEELTRSLINEQGIIDNTAKDYTGIVIDLRAVYGFKDLLTVKIVLNNGEQFFSIRDLSQDVLRKFGGFPVYSSIRDAILDPNGVGNRPVKVFPDNYGSETGEVFVPGVESMRILNLRDLEKLVFNGKLALIL